MIDLNSQLAALEKLMELMDTYKIDEVSCDFVMLKKSKFSKEETTSKEILDQHTNPKTLADLKAISQTRIADVEAWLEKGTK